MWSPVAAIKKSLRRSSNDGPPSAPLDDSNDGGMWSPVAALKRSFRMSKATTAGIPMLGDDDEDENLAGNNVSNGDLQRNHNDQGEEEESGNQQLKKAEDQQDGRKRSNNNQVNSTTNNNDPNNEEEDDPSENADDERGFNTRLSGLNFRLLADDDFGDDVEGEDDDDDEDGKNDDEEFDFNGESDDDLIDRAFFGVDVSDSEGEEEYFNEWYLKDDEEGFLAPILFEDGMNSDECDLYYITLEEDKLQATTLTSHGIAMARRSLPTQFRSALPLRRIEEEEEDELPSCLRKPKNRPVRKDIVPLRRRSFGGLPALPDTPEFYRPHSCPDLSTLHSPHLRPKVNFDTEVQVVTVFAAADYPRKIRSTLWFTKKQIRASRKEASYERRQERRQREKDEAAGLAHF